MIGRYRSKFKQFDDNGLERKKILDVKSAKRKLTYVAKKKIEEVRI